MTTAANVYTVGTASVTIVPPSPEPQRVTITNIQPDYDPDKLARDGYVFEVGQLFTLANNGTAAFQITTGSDGAQFQYYQIDADESSVYAELLEGATFGSATAVPAFNLNRNFPDTYASELTAATAVSGGTAIAKEYVPASNQGGNLFTNANTHTLAPNTSYVMKFVDDGGNGTKVFFKLGFAEQFNGLHDVWINGEINAALKLGASETMTFTLWAGESLNAKAVSADCKISLLTQVQT
jgi:hypothetical protein